MLLWEEILKNMFIKKLAAWSKIEWILKTCNSNKNQILTCKQPALIGIQASIQGPTPWNLFYCYLYVWKSIALEQPTNKQSCLIKIGNFIVWNLWDFCTFIIFKKIVFDSTFWLLFKKFFSTHFFTNKVESGIEPVATDPIDFGDPTNTPLSMPKH